MLFALALIQLTGQVRDEAVIGWLRKHAVPIKTVQPGNGFEDLQQVGKSLRGVRLVGMGEPTHGTREACLFKHRMFEYLAERQGYRVFGMEASFPDCLPIEKYIQTGEGDPEAVVHRQGFWTWDTEEVLGLVQWMRSYNLSHTERVHFVGFDTQAEGPAYARVIDFLKAWRSSNLANLPMTNPTGKDLTLALSILDENRRELTRKSGTEAFAIARQCAAVAIQAFKAEQFNSDDIFKALMKTLARSQEDVDALRKAGWVSKPVDEVLKGVNDSVVGHVVVRSVLERIQAEPGTLAKGTESHFQDLKVDLNDLAKQLETIEAAVGWRDKCMADNTAWIVGTLYPRAKTMLWAHNYHIGSSVPQDNASETMGRHLTTRFGKAYFPIGFSFGDGSFQSRLMSPTDPIGPLQEFQVGPPSKGSLDEVLGKAGSLFMAKSFTQ